MRVLIDTNVFLWWTDDHQRLSHRAREIIGDGANDVLFSAASAWEIAIKAQLGRLQLPPNLTQFIGSQLVENHFMALPIQINHALQVFRLPMLHRDPYDRVLIAQSQLEDAPIVTADPMFSRYEVQILW